MVIQMPSIPFPCGMGAHFNRLNEQVAKNLGHGRSFSAEGRVENAASVKRKGLMASAVIERPVSGVAESESSPHVQRREDEGAFMSKGIKPKTESGVATADERVGKYLTFLLGREEFAIRVLKVREIMGIQDITAVPQTPQYVKGVINLRGKVIPVVDLRLKFCLPEKEYSQRTCIIVVQVQAGGVSLQTGIIVDEVSEVLNLAAGEIEDTPDFGEGAATATAYLLGMAKVKGKVKILLDIDRVLSGQEVRGLDALAQN
jgi:purine-binding chemotaxis protein CheW